MEQWYFYHPSGHRMGPMDTEQLKRLAKTGKINPNTIVETEDGQKTPASKIRGLEFSGTTPSPEPVPVPPLTFTSPSPTFSTSAGTSVRYEYKCVAAPMIIETTKGSSEAAAVESYANFINKHCSNGWEFYSMEQITTSTPPGCLLALLGGKPINTIHNMLVFRRQI